MKDRKLTNASQKKKQSQEDKHIKDRKKQENKLSKERKINK